MNYLLSKKYDGTFTMNFIGIQFLTQSDNTMYLRPTSSIYGVKKITDFTTIVRGTNSYQYVKIYFKYQNKYDNPSAECQDCWSELMPISAITGITCIPNQPFDIELFYYRVDDPPFDAQHPRKNIYVGDDNYSLSVVITGEYEFNWTDGPFILQGTTDEVVLIPKDIYKIFSVRDFQIISDDVNNLELHYRVTQDNGRTYSKWEPLNKANISTFRFNNLRFARMEYKVKLIYNDDITPNNVYDIILVGDFQNVSANYLKTNRYGIRQDCLVSYLNPLTGNTDTCGWNISTTSGSSYGIAPGNGNITPAMTPYDLNMNFYTQGLSCYTTSATRSNADAGAGGVQAGIAAENRSNQDTLWKPYDITQIMTFANTMANQLNSIFAWEVDYHLTDPDSNGTDFVLHEYQLFNIVDMKKVKILVPDNKFPDNMVKFNQFSLDLFDTFEIHILKDEFKRKFGIDRRPAENDIIFFCQINRLFYVKHAQIFRDVMNAGYYYKVILEKYEQKANIRNLHEESKAMLDILTKNTTMDELFGPEKAQEEQLIANVEQFKPFTFDPMRYVVNNKVIRVEESLFNGNFDFSKTHYDFKNVIGKQAIIYKKTDNILTESSNRSIVCWFNINNLYDPDRPVSKAVINSYDVDMNTNFWLLDNYDESLKRGYRLWLFKKDINLQINEEYYKLSGLDLLTNIWYALVININQRQKNINMSLYTRDNDYNIIMFHPTSYQKETISWLDTTGYTYYITAGFKPINNEELRNASTEHVAVKESNYNGVYVQSFEHEYDLQIKGSDIKYTNLRILTDVIPNSEINGSLNQFYVANAEKVLLADNADKNIYTNNYINKNWT
jgi:hypothetical protein